jgi:hypothetical protein
MSVRRDISRAIQAMSKAYDLEGSGEQHRSACLCVCVCVCVCVLVSVRM